MPTLHAYAQPYSALIDLCLYVYDHCSIWFPLRYSFLLYTHMKDVCTDCCLVQLDYSLPHYQLVAFGKTTYFLLTCMYVLCSCIASIVSMWLFNAYDPDASHMWSVMSLLPVSPLLWLHRHILYRLRMCICLVQDLKFHLNGLFLTAQYIDAFIYIWPTLVSLSILHLTLHVHTVCMPLLLYIYIYVTICFLLWSMYVCVTDTYIYWVYWFMS